MAQSVKNLPAVQETRVQFLSQEDPLEKEMATHSSILAWRIPGQRRLAGHSPWGCMTQRLNRHKHQGKSEVSGFEDTLLPPCYGCFSDTGSVRGVSEFTQKRNSLENLKRFFKDDIFYVALVRNMPVGHFFLQGTMVDGPSQLMASLIIDLAANEQQTSGIFH